MARMLVLKGGAWCFGDDVDTDAILPARYLNLTAPSELGEHCMEDVAPGFASRVRPGDILVAGRNFGCGSSREHAPVALYGCGISCVVAKSFSRLFYRNAVAIGLPALMFEDDFQIEQGTPLEVDCAAGTLRNTLSGKSCALKPLPDFMMEILTGGGIVPYIEKRLEKK